MCVSGWLTPHIYMCVLLIAFSPYHVCFVIFYSCFKIQILSCLLLISFDFSPLSSTARFIFFLPSYFILFLFAFYDIFFFCYNLQSYITSTQQKKMLFYLYLHQFEFEMKALAFFNKSISRSAPFLRQPVCEYILKCTFCAITLSKNEIKALRRKYMVISFSMCVCLYIGNVIYISI